MYHKLPYLNVLDAPPPFFPPPAPTGFHCYCDLGLFLPFFSFLFFSFLFFLFFCSSPFLLEYRHQQGKVSLISRMMSHNGGKFLFFFFCILYRDMYHIVPGNPMLCGTPPKPLFLTRSLFLTRQRYDWLGVAALPCKIYSNLARFRLLPGRSGEGGGGEGEMLYLL